MKHGAQKKIAEKAGISPAFLSELISTKKRPSWHTAKKLSIVTHVDPVIWLEGSAKDIKEALSDNGEGYKKTG